MIGLVDGNNFYVSCERIFDPTLEGRPVAVLSNNDGCAVSRSNEFKALGIPMGTPYFQIKPMMKAHGIVLRSSNYELYGDISRRIVAILKEEFARDVEQYSIDEAFIYADPPADSTVYDFACEIRSTILKWVGVPCGVGFAKTKTLAKIANHIGKKRPDGVFIMPDDPTEILAVLPVDEVWGVGRNLSAKLRAYGITTAKSLAHTDEFLLRKIGGVILAKTAHELRGEPAIAAETPDADAASISCSRSFGKPVTSLDEMTEAIAFYTARACEKLRRKNQRAAGANIYLQYYPEYKPVEIPGGFCGTTVQFPEPTCATSPMLRAIRPRLDGIFLQGRRYKKAGVIFYGLESCQARQMDFFNDHAENDREETVSKLIDSLNAKLGKGAVFNLAEGTSRSWAMRRDLLSPDYTTNWNSIPSIGTLSRENRQQDNPQ